MPRNMIAANVTLFKNLDDYCASRGDPVGNVGSPRWIATEPSHREILKHSIVSAHILFTPRRGVVRIDHGRNNYFCTVGFDYEGSVRDLVIIDPNPGLLTVLLAELNIQPRVSSVEVRDVVEAADRVSTPSYAGHDPTLIGALYPVIAAFSGKDVAQEETWKVFFLLCLAECRSGETWIQPKFANALQMLAELPLLNVPFRTLCRSIFDTDPGAMFLALYRCLEGLYAYASARDVSAALKLKNTWEEVAATLEDTLGWYPREENSLAALFMFGAELDHHSIFAALGEEAPAATGPISAAAARRIYKLRNDLVHFRPSQARVDVSTVDWNMLCEAVAGLVCYIYAEVFADRMNELVQSR